MQQINQRIRLTIVLFLVIISLFIFLGIYRPLTTELENEVLKSYQLITYNKHQVVEEFVASSRYNAASLSSRSVIRDMLANHLEGKVTFEELKTFTIPRYTDGVAVFDQLRSSARFIADGRMICSIGPDESMEDYIIWGEKELISKYIPEENIVTVQSPIKKGEQILGYDVILTDASNLITSLEEGLYKLKFLGETRNEEVVVANKIITSYLDCELLGGTIAISTDESIVFDTVRSLIANINIRYFIVMIIMFLIIQFLIVRYISKFVKTQQKLKAEAEDREKEINCLYEKLKDSEELMNMTLDVTGEGVWDWHIEEGMVYHNKRWCAIMRLDECYFSHSMDEFTSKLFPDDRNQVMKLINEAIDTQGEYFSEHRIIHHDGSIIWVVDRGAVIKSPDGKARRMIGSISDISQRKKAELDLFLEKETFQSTLLSVGEGIISTDVNGIITVINPIAEELTEWKQEAIGRNIEEVIKLLDPETKKPLDWRNNINQKNELTTDVDNLVLLVSRSGKEITIFENMSHIYLPDGGVAGFVMTFRDITEVFEKQKRIEYMSFHDELTGLYNRRYFEDALHRLDTNRNIPFTIMMLDLNNLKLANDIFGHDLGDNLIKKTAQFLRDIFRSDDIIARIGGDEFCVLMPRTSMEAAQMVKERIENTSHLYWVEPLRLSIAVGYVVKTQMSEKIDEAIRDADMCMYNNKQENRKKVINRTIEDIIENNYLKLEMEKEHNDRVGDLAGALYEALGKSQEEVGEFKRAAQIHDIGKIIVPSEILNKKEELTKSDWEKIRKHSRTGCQILRLLKEYEDYAEVILYHHERIDGKGYPEGLEGETIPLESRVIAIADAYEAMTAYRPYKKARSKEEAVAELQKNAGTQFDGKLVDIFIQEVLSIIAE